MKRDIILQSKFCKFCGNNFIPKTIKQVNCSRACYRKTSNPRVFYKKPCLNCGTILDRGNSRFCNNYKCHFDYNFKKKFDLWIKGEIQLAKHSLKRCVIHRDGYKCSVCGISEWNKNPISLELHHIDGKYFNNSAENVCLLCLNCHSQTSNYGSKNKGNGRPWRIKLDDKAKLLEKKHRK